MRLQLALNVKNIENAITYYSAMFDTPPHKIRDGYANFEIANPPLKLVLFENPDADEHLNHLGVELFDAADIGIAKKRLEDAGLMKSVEVDSICCHAQQDKLWTKDDTELSWEWYSSKDDNLVESAQKVSQCCSDALEQNSA
ncbi:MAG TPA: glyoxalase/bleomycin resistance/extradiol dioxygenase family protein [Sneathiellales bacterium]|nr:glyoxalase/bleomycin resistance/extradiol dioxygenase family protein [Sneathiellales bacterium]